MGYEPLHHKYRPQTFTELVGQDAIAQTLSHALEQQRIAPAYLFCGPRGTGKTSSARILAKSLNCLNHSTPTPHPCGQCEVCSGISTGSILDIVEIDAASNTGVDNIRELIERAQFAPVQCRYKVYVIDECHMLSTAAFNALLKTLEEPPEHVIFVLATTDPQRVLPTIISRCQRFDFRRIPLEAMVTHLQAIAQREDIEITEAAIRLVSQIAQGGLRDAQSLLDQLSLLEPPIDAEKVWDLVGAVPECDLLSLVQAIAADDSITTLDTVRRLMDRGREPMVVLQNLAGFYRDLIIAKTAGARADLVPVTPPTWAAMQEFGQSVALPLLLAGQKTLREAETQLRNTTQPRLWLEVTLMSLLSSAQVPTPSVGAIAPAPVAAAPPRPAAPPKAATTRTDPPAPVSPAPPTPPPASTITSAPPPSPAASEAQPAVSPPPEEPVVEPAPVAPNATESTPDLVTLWTQIIANVKPMGTRALLQQQGHLISYSGRAARVGIKSHNLLKMAQSKLPNIEAAFQQLLNQPVKVSLEVAAAPPGSAAPTPAPAAPTPTTLAPAPSPTSAPAISPPPAEAIANSPSGVDSLTPTTPAAEPPPPTGTQNWRSESDIDRAVKSFAEFFNGQIVNLEEDEAADPATQAGNGRQAKPSSSPGKDVPF